MWQKGATRACDGAARLITVSEDVRIASAMSCALEGAQGPGQTSAMSAEECLTTESASASVLQAGKHQHLTCRSYFETLFVTCIFLVTRTKSTHRPQLERPCPSVSRTKNVLTESGLTEFKELHCKFHINWSVCHVIKKNQLNTH